MKLFISSLLFLTALAFVFPLKSFADTSCQPMYGGGQSCVTTNYIIVNKTVLNPQTNQFVDNLGISDPRYRPGFITTFHISITNTSNNTISKVDVRDIFPQYISFSYGAGSFDTNTNTLYFSVINLAPNETRTYSIVGRVFNMSQIPITPGSVVCVVNQAIATIGDTSVGQDNAQLCIENSPPVIASGTTNNSGFPILSPSIVSKAPDTGPEMFGLLAMIPTGIAGWILRKKAIKKEAGN